VLFFVLAFALWGANAAVPADLITSLPGWDGDLPSKHYSGYLPVGKDGTKFLHYWFIESENDPTTDPVTLWLNGGPGSSSLIGLFTENGQIATNDNSLNGTGTPKLFYNQYSWQQVSSTIYLESPAGVGFSYCLQAGTNKTVECTNTDDSTASDSYDFLVNFFNAYPEYVKNEFYITGESYAGIYIPMLTQQIMNNKPTNINLKGLAIGDGCWGNTVGTCAFSSGDAMRISANFYHGHALFSEVLWATIESSCGDFSKISAQCEQALAQMNVEIGSFDVYNIYDECGVDDLRFLDYFEKDTPEGPYYLKAFAKNYSTVVEALNQRKHSQPSQLQGGVNGDYYCGGETAMDRYLADASVRTAIHVRSDNPGQRYTKTATDLRPLYKSIVPLYRMLIYSGDADACVPYYGTEEWTYDLGYDVSQVWRPWSSDYNTGHYGTAGYVTQFNTNNFTFLTIKGAGHMVPTYKAAPALHMISRYLTNQPY